MDEYTVTYTVDTVKGPQRGFLVVEAETHNRAFKKATQTLKEQNLARPQITGVARVTEPTPFTVGLADVSGSALGSFSTEQEAAEYIETLPGYEDGRYYLDGPEEEVEGNCAGCNWNFSEEPEHIAEAQDTGQCPNCGRILEVKE